MKNSLKQSTGSESLKSSDNESLKKELTSSGSLQNNSTNSHSLKASDKMVNGESELALIETDDLIITEVPDSIIKTLESAARPAPGTSGEVEVLGKNFIKKGFPPISRKKT